MEFSSCVIITFVHAARHESQVIFSKFQIHEFSILYIIPNTNLHVPRSIKAWVSMSVVIHLRIVANREFGSDGGGNETGTEKVGVGESKRRAGTNTGHRLPSVFEVKSSQNRSRSICHIFCMTSEERMSQFQT